MERRLTAILAADVVGYSRLVAIAEERALAAFDRHVGELIRPAVEQHHGRLIKTTGDCVLAAFASAVSALHCAVAIQRGMGERNAGASADERFDFRIGVNVADVVIAGDDVLGDGVNVAARLEGLADAGGICVSARVQEDAQGRIEVGFQDMGDQRLKNIPRPVRAYRVLLDGQTPPEPLRRTPSSKPSILVLPFRNMSSEPDQEYFADAITEDLIIALSRWRWFFVIARDSSFALRAAGMDRQRLAEELSVRYVLDGRVRKSGARFRVSAQLIEVATDAAIWADHLDGDLNDILIVQDEVVEQVVAAIEPAMLHSEARRATRKSVKDYSALDCFQRGMWHLNRVSQEDYGEAIRHFRASIAHDPDLPLGHIGLSRILYGGVIYGWSKDPAADLHEAAEAAEAAIALDARDAIAYYALAGAALYLGRYEQALDAARKSVALNPNFAYGHVRLGQLLIYAGRPAQAIAPIERGLKRSPYDPQLGTILTLLAFAHYHAEDYETAAVHAQAGLARKYPGAAVVLAASLGRLGRPEQIPAGLSAELLPRLLREQPQLFAYARPEDRDRLLDGLRLAGLVIPELIGAR